MFKRAFAVGLCGVVIALSGSPAMAAPGVPGVVASGPVRVADASADLEWTWYLAFRDPRALIRVSAQLALSHTDQEAAVARFLNEEFDYLVSLSDESDARNADFVHQVLETYLPDFSPEVNAAARQVVNGTAAQREEFVRTGFDAAKERDRLAREASGAQKRAIIEADRAFVRHLGEVDPGEQVRSAVKWALRPGSDDGDLVEFFAYGWASAGQLDLDAFRMASANNNTVWRATAHRLAAEAQAAEKAAREAADEVAVQLREAAARAWRTAADQTAPARTAWADAQEFALRQAENWRAVAAAAQAATGPNWQAIGGPAQTNLEQWTAERQSAVEQAQYWKDLLAQAEAGEKRMLEKP
ncbi:hypothetical protein [Amycolatopsis anabasis]|uniref:hypothetical protein n=1 Tax=Amycolatopsis anabasis TaxID=1840409 RepID=UPI001FE6C6E8|nr:hypothetical protein [Amycolatopsis anabasis]